MIKRAASRIWRRDRARNGSVLGKSARRVVESKRITDWRVILRRRVTVAGTVICVWTVGIEARLLYLQVVQHEELVSRAARQQMRTISAPAKRGEILDRQGQVLAYSVDADSIYAVPTEIAHAAEAAAALCQAFGDCSDAEQQRIRSRLERPRAFAYVRRQVAPDAARRVADLNLEGVGFLKESRRYYPKRELAAQLLGYVGIDSIGLGGIESAYDSHIRGRPGKILIQTDARRRAFSRVERPPTRGATVELTIDQYLQHITERALRSGVAAHDAVAGTAIIMDPSTGEILALANEPTFNPNAFAKAPPDDRRNRAVQDIYEPGSTFKIVTASAALEEGVAHPDDLIDVSAGMIRFGSRRIDDVHRYESLSFTDVIVKSSNVGAIKIGLQLGPDRLGRYVQRFGFGRTLSPDFRGESTGIVWNPASLDDSAVASVSMGYQIGVTPLQMASAVSSIANGGNLVEPRVVRALVRGASSTVVPSRVIHRAVSEETAQRLTEIMEAVVERGTGRAARLDGYTIAGKTGTAAKVVDGRYSDSEYFASFVGFVPSRNPVITILVVIDSPHAGQYYGGAVAAPIFREIAEASMRYLRVLPNINPPPPVLVGPRPLDDWGTMPVADRPTEPPRVRQVMTSSDRAMPLLEGLSAREALQALTQAGVTAHLRGTGVVVRQEPLAGTRLERGATSIIWLDRRSPRAAPVDGGTEP